VDVSAAEALKLLVNSFGLDLILSPTVAASPLPLPAHATLAPLPDYLFSSHD
jgi:hypothetical protein